MLPEGRPAGSSKPLRARVFFALWPGAELARQLAAIAGDMAQRCGGRPMRRETIHLTLAFLGEVPEEMLPELIRRAATITVEPFVLHLDRLGYWSHNHLLWAGCATPPALAGLVATLRVALAGSGLVVDGGRHDFTPHVTLLRKIPIQAELPGRQSLAPISWPCTRFVLVRSRLSDSGPDYQVLSEFPPVS